MAMKLDMSKAYDRVEWCFLEKILLHMGFIESWVAMIMQCVSIVTYSILINGEPKGFIYTFSWIETSRPTFSLSFPVLCRGPKWSLMQSSRG